MPSNRFHEEHAQSAGIPVRASATKSAVVTPSDTALIEFRALYIGGAGNVAIKHIATDTAVVYTSVPAGSFLPVESGPGGGLVMSTATTATSIVAMDW